MLDSDMLKTLAVIVGLSSTAASAAPVTATRCVAHRGDSGAFLENSIAAALSAVEVGADAVELDIRHTLDGVAVIMHDATLLRTARSRPGARCPVLTRVSEIPYALIESSCELENGEPVPTLDRFLATVVPTGTMLFVELKDDPTLRTLETVERWFRPFPERLRMIGFSEKRLRRARTLGGAFYQNAKFLDLARNRWCASTEFEGVDVAGASLRYTRWHQARGREVGVWTVDSEDGMKKYFDRGVDFITTNEPARCAALRARRPDLDPQRRDTDPSVVTIEAIQGWGTGNPGTGSSFAAGP